MIVALEAPRTGQPKPESYLSADRRAPTIGLNNRPNESLGFRVGLSGPIVEFILGSQGKVFSGSRWMELNASSPCNWKVFGVSPDVFACVLRMSLTTHPFKYQLLT